MKNVVYGLSFGFRQESGKYENPFQAIVIDEKLEECREYAKQLGYDEIPIEPLQEVAKDFVYEDHKKKGYKRFFEGQPRKHKQ